MPVRRTYEDRRQQDLGPPPGWKDRRHSVERRQIQVSEVSYQEWEFAVIDLTVRNGNINSGSQR